MRVRTTREPLPRCFEGHPDAQGLLFEKDLRITEHGRLRAKLLVFSGPRAMRAFWKRAVGESIGKAFGVVNVLSTSRTKWKGEREESWLECDPRYFCMIGLCKGHLQCSIVMHEAVHVGFAYAKRMRGNPWAHYGDLDEEEIAYPAGFAAREITNALYESGLYPDA